MREVNFSVPSVNRASTCIHTSIYDRRALDCTSLLPLLNSLNHLAYLTLSSPRIRQILTLDGGVERLVTMLKKGKGNNSLEKWKWHLALQCVVNIGVRGSDARASDAQGSESIRTRVVEADIVPVIATVLDNYMQGLEARKRFRHGEGDLRVEELGRLRSIHQIGEIDIDASRSQRRRPPPIAVPPETGQLLGVTTDETTQPEPLSAANLQPSLLSSPVDPSPYSNLHNNNLHRPNRSETLSSPSTERPNSPVGGNGRQHNTLGVRDTYHFPQLATNLRPDDSSQPGTPTTPTALSRSGTRRRAASAGPSVPRTVRQSSSMSGDSDEGEQSGDPTVSGPHDRDEDAIVQVNASMDIEMEVQPNVLEPVEAQEDFADPEVTGDADSETFNIRHRSVDGSLVEAEAQPLNPVFTTGGGMMDPTAIPDNSGLIMAPVPPMPQEAPLNDQGQVPYRGTAQDDIASSGVFKWKPRDEDVVLSLQLLAYVSKYCALRPYFQNTHLVPNLKSKPEGANLDSAAVADTTEEDQDNEYCQPDDYNIFPLVEKFTVRHYSSDMKYWACVVMRNLCRKDKTRGDIRQCAYYKCGKWEEYARQFAKCRRCRQTKYCSKECQKAAWVFHRHWCEPARESYQRHQHAHHPSGHDHDHSHGGGHG